MKRAGRHPKLLPDNTARLDCCCCEMSDACSWRARLFGGAKYPFNEPPTWFATRIRFCGASVPADDPCLLHLLLFGRRIPVKSCGVMPRASDRS
jgi:hypothetical protein